MAAQRTPADLAEQQIAGLMEAGLTRDEAVDRYISGLRPEYGQFLDDEAAALAERDAIQNEPKANGHDVHAASEAPEPPIRRPMRWAELAGHPSGPPARQWFIEHWLGTGPTLFAGPGGAGKTLLAQTISTSLVTMRGFVDKVLQPRRVLYWACEDEHDEIWRRQLAICNYFGVTLADLEGQFVLEPRLGLENSLSVQLYGAHTWTPLFLELKAQCNDYAADVLILDNIGQTFGGNENDRHHVTAFVNGLMGLVQGRPFAVILLAHPSKSAGAEYSGSTAWENAVRMRWYLGATLPDATGEEAEPEENVRYLAKRKTNYSVRDYRKLQWENGLYVPAATPGEFQQRYTAASREEAADIAIRAALIEFKSKTIRACIGPKSSDYLPRKMRAMKIDGGCSQGELAKALSRLEFKGALQQVPFGKYGNRNTMHTTVLVSE